jgi:pyruvate formate lyase activating enzyme
MASILAEEKGWITNIQDFSLHDGPGIRVLVFLRGCPLNCSWCQNPESYDLFPQIEFHRTLCLRCWRCIEVCPVPGAIIRNEDQRIDRTKCTKCMVCVGECPGKALKKAGEQVLVGELVEKITRYKPFFDHSDRGGITLSGGEPTFQPEFTLRVLKSCRESGIHTVMETCGYVTYKTLKKIMQYVDLLIYDIKHMDETKHIAGTGRSNRLILKNLRRLCKEKNGTEIIVHIPLICGFNDDEENIDETAKFVKSLKKINHIDLLPFNELASEKYRAMGLHWEYCGVKRQSIEYLTRLQEIIQSYGIEVTIGGLW